MLARHGHPACSQSCRPLLRSYLAKLRKLRIGRFVPFRCVAPIPFLLARVRTPVAIHDALLAIELKIPMTHRHSYAYRVAIVACMTFVVSACDAQKPAPTAVTSSGAAAAPSKPLFSEPAVRGKIVDAVTQQPIQGVIVYGFYATTGGGTLAGGSKFGQHVKSFETETDASGVFTLPAWDTGTRVISGTMGNKFPMIGFYKPGYDLWYDNLSSVAQYRPKSGIAGTEVEIKDGVREWTKFPHRLPPITNERDRYSALDDSGRMMMFEGECGWEAYAKLLLVQHNDLKEWYQRNIPVSELDTKGYPKGTAQLPAQFRRLSIVFESTVDRLIKLHARSSNSWACSDPQRLLGAAI